MRDATVRLHKTGVDRTNFNPRIPCGMRRTECRFANQYYHFNPRIPCGMRQFFLPFCYDLILFQSTHPMRDAT